MRNQLFFYITFLLLANNYVHAQVGIGTPTPSSKLEVVGAGTTSATAALKVGNASSTILTVRNDGLVEISSTTQGFLPPRVALTATNSTSPINSPATGTLVYNTTAGTSTATTNVTPGLYYYDGSKWQRIINQQPDATVSFNTSNPNTGSPAFTPNTPASTDYVYVSSLDNSQWTYNGTAYVTYTPPASTPWYLSSGTSDAGSNKTAAIYRTGNVGIGNSSPNAKLHVEASATTAPSLTWNALSGQILRNEAAELAIGLSNSNPWPMYMQARTNTNAQKALVINPLGGNVGIGNSAPNARLDIRTSPNSTSDPGAGYLGIGTTSTAANTAGAGAVRYENTGGELEYSNGISWKPLAVTDAAQTFSGTQTFSNSLVVNGSGGTGTGLKLPVGASSGKILTSDVNGNASWQTGSVVIYTEVHASDNIPFEYSAGTSFNEFTIIKADNVISLYGSSYGFLNGSGSGSNADRWVAPRAGKYRITTNAYFNHSPLYSNPRLYALKNNTEVCNITSATTAGQDIATSTSAIIQLNQGEYINWKIMGSGALLWLGPYHTFFRIESVE